MRSLQYLDFTTHYSHAVRAVAKCSTTKLHDNLQPTVELTEVGQKRSQEFYQNVTQWDTFAIMDPTCYTPYMQYQNMVLAEVYTNTFSDKSTLTLTEASTLIIIRLPPQ